MKNYTKLVLVVLAVLSSLCFLFYKIKYDRLYNIVQVLEVFGTPPQTSANKLRYGLPGAPSWRRLEAETEVYVYSAGCNSLPGDSSSPCPQVSVIALTAAGDELLRGFKCKLWYEGSVQPLEGAFSSQVETAGLNISHLLISYLYCETKYAARVPYGVSFYKTKDHVNDVIGVSPVQELKPAEKSKLGVCVLPSKSSADRASSLKETFLVHVFLGVTEFIIFSPALPHSFVRTANKVQSETNVQIRHFPWSPPGKLSLQQQRQLATQACYYNSRHTENYIVLEDNQVLLPDRSTNLTHTLSGLTLAAGPNQLEVRRFCSEYTNDPRSTGLKRPITFLQSTHFNTDLSQGRSAPLYHLGRDQSADPLCRGCRSVRVHEYGACDRFDISERDATAVHDSDLDMFFNQLPSFIAKYIES